MWPRVVGATTRIQFTQLLDIYAATHVAKWKATQVQLYVAINKLATQINIGQLLVMCYSYLFCSQHYRLNLLCSHIAAKHFSLLQYSSVYVTLSCLYRSCRANVPGISTQLYVYTAYKLLTTIAQHSLGVVTFIWNVLPSYM